MGTVGEQDIPLFLLTYTGWFPLLTIISFKEGFFDCCSSNNQGQYYLAEGRFSHQSLPYYIRTNAEAPKINKSTTDRG